MTTRPAIPVLLLLAGGLLAGTFLPNRVQAQATESADALVGTWTGTLETDASVYESALRLQRGEGGEPIALFFVIDGFGTPRWTASSVRAKGDSLVFEIPSVGLRFEGMQTADGSALEGTMSTITGKYPLRLSPAPDSLADSLPQPPEAQRPEANPADVESPEAIVDASFAALSVPEGEEPDLGRFRSLFLPDAQVTVTFHGDETSHYGTGSVDEYVDKEVEGLEGTHEQAVHTVVERYGDIAHVFATYEARQSADDPEPIARGIDSFQLWYDGSRWWIVNVMGHGESEDTPLPERYEN